MADTGIEGYEERERRVIDGWSSWASCRDDGEYMKRIAWAEYPLTAGYINRRISGSEGIDWLQWAGREYFPEPAGLGLSIGCGSGNVERRMLKAGMASRVEAVDVSEEALALARKKADGLPIDYRRVDLNIDELPSGRYDVAVSAATLHHVTNLEHCLWQINAALKPEGLLVLSEFVGPDRFQWTERQLQIINGLYSRLPERYRHNLLTGRTPAVIGRRPLGDMIKADPSEAVRSSEIEGMVGRFFDVVERKEIGGTLLHPMLEGILGNFDEREPVDRALINVLMAAEEKLIEDGDMPSDFVMMVCRRKEPDMSMEKAMEEGNRKLSVITRQEREITELNRRLEEAEEVNRALSEAVEEGNREVDRLKRDRSRLLEENEMLKAHGPLRTLRFVRAKIRGSRRERGRSGSE